MQKPNIVIRGPFFSMSGYGAHSRDILSALFKSDKFNIYTEVVGWGGTSNTSDLPPDMLSILSFSCRNEIRASEPYIYLQIGMPFEFQTKGSINIGVTAGLEADRFPESWTEPSIKMDGIIVPSHFMERRFKNLNDTINVKVIGEGVDIDVFHPRDPGDAPSIDLSSIKEDFCFLLNGQWLNGEIGVDRKQIGLAIKLFNETFYGSPEVALVVKTSQINQSSPDAYITNQAIQEYFGEQKRRGNVYLLHGILTREELVGLYTHPKIKAFYSCTSGEGWFRPLAEAIACDLPCLVTGWSGHMDYVDPQHTTIFESTMVEVPSQNFYRNFFETGMLWARVVDEDVRGKLMETVMKYDVKEASARMQGHKFRKNINFIKSGTDQELVDYIDKHGKVLMTLQQPKDTLNVNPY